MHTSISRLRKAAVKSALLCAVLALPLAAAHAQDNPPPIRPGDSGFNKPGSGTQGNWNNRQHDQSGQRQRPSADGQHKHSSQQRPQHSGQQQHRGRDLNRQRDRERVPN